jgi:hypothetical protein
MYFIKEEDYINKAKFTGLLYIRFDLGFFSKIFLNDVK